MKPSAFHPAGAPAATAAACDIGMVGLAVMGANLALNMADHGFATAAYNRTTSVAEAFIKYNAQTPGGLHAFADLKDFVRSLKRPRRITILVKAGPGTDAVIDSLTPLLDKGDCIIDGGNAHWEDTIRREKALRDKGLLFVGSGVSGGELGARFGPSLMPGGDEEAWNIIKPVWTAIAAKVDARSGKPLLGGEPGTPVVAPPGVAVEPCAAHIGPRGAGHYVKMVHNGIEYGDMQMICEAYDLLRRIVGLTPNECAAVFADWNTGELDSFLVEITADILQQKDPVTGRPFVDVVLDAAGQKGTGKWTSVSALDLGVPAATIAEAVFARLISAVKDERTAAAKTLRGPAHAHYDGPKDLFVACVRDALYCSKICSYAQGFQLISAGAKEQGWTPDFKSISAIWRGGCIIRARFLHEIAEAYHARPDLPNLMLAPFFADALNAKQHNWRRAVSTAATLGVPVPTFSSALAYYDSYRSETLPANLLQAQRDYFGAHTYERTDQPRGNFFHLDWPEKNRPQLQVEGGGGH